MKNTVVMFCTLPLVAPSQKAPVSTPPGTRKMGNVFFMSKLEKH
jgi:hypothetical protein